MDHAQRGLAGWSNVGGEENLEAFEELLAFKTYSVQSLA